MHIESMLWARQTLGYPPPPFVQAVDVPDASGGPLGEDARVPAGRYWIGMPARSADFAGRDFAFDAEKPGLWVDLPAFAISRTLVSNREFLRFVEAGGYRDESHWSWGGRKWLRVHAARDPDVTRPAQGAPAGPLYWKEEEGGWWLRHFERWLPLPLDCPVTHVSYWEAEAYCQWAGRRLPSEYEWEAAALGRTEEASPRIFPWGERMEAERADLDARSGGLQPVTAFPAGDSPFGCRQMLGSAWEWTASPFLPYPGFTADMYPFMSTLQFGYHKTVKGGSCATASALIRGTYRQAYLPQRRDVFVGFRTCAK
jgi:iron(II)-dependent oxidoreductase